MGQLFNDLLHIRPANQAISPCRNANPATEAKSMVDPFRVDPFRVIPLKVGKAALMRISVKQINALILNRLTGQPRTNPSRVLAIRPLTTDYDAGIRCPVKNYGLAHRFGHSLKISALQGRGLSPPEALADIKPPYNGRNDNQG